MPEFLLTKEEWEAIIAALPAGDTCGQCREALAQAALRKVVGLMKAKTAQWKCPDGHTETITLWNEGEFPALLREAGLEKEVLFKARFVEPILSGQKITTWRVKRPVFRIGDTFSCQSTGMRVFARVRVKAIEHRLLEIDEETAYRDGFRNKLEMFQYCLTNWRDILWSTTPMWKITFELVKPQVEGQ